MRRGADITTKERSDFLFTGDYGFFDYKYDISGYNGQDFGGPAQYLYLALSALLLILLLLRFRRASEAQLRCLLRSLGIFLTLFYLGKTAWETVYDVRRSGAFNTGLLPLDSCSIVMPAALLAGFCRGRLGRAASCWLSTGGLVGGIGAMVRLNAFNYYPFFSFGAFYSMLWHFLMVFLGLLTAVADASAEAEEAAPERRLRRVLLGSRRVRRGFVFHLCFSALVIPVDFLFDFDFMLFRDLGGLPVFESVAARLTEAGLRALNPLLMLVLYFLGFRLADLICRGVRRLCRGGGRREASALSA